MCEVLSVTASALGYGAHKGLALGREFAKPWLKPVLNIVMELHISLVSPALPIDLLQAGSLGLWICVNWPDIGVVVALDACCVSFAPSPKGAPVARMCTHCHLPGIALVSICCLRLLLL